MQKRKTLLTIALSILMLITTIVPLTAQDDIIVISVAMPELIGGQIDQGVFDRYEAEHPGIQIHRVGKGDFTGGILPTPLLPVDEYLDSVADYVSAADVLAVTPTTLTQEATRAGYYLDMTPLVTSDPDLFPDDFYPAMYESYQWDLGFWAMPTSADVIGLAYSPEAFDTAGIDYPQDWWTIDDFEIALRALAEYDNSGDVTAPAFVDYTGNTSLLFLSLIGQGVYDDSMIPSVPAYNNPMLEDVITRWAEWVEEGLVGGSSSASLESTPPMSLAPTILAYNPAVNADGKLAVLPGGKMGLLVNGFGISSGTQYPQESYELIKYLTQTPEVANAFFPTVVAAHRMTADSQNENAIAAILNIPPEIAENAIQNGLPVAETRFGRYLNSAIDRVALEDEDVVFALQDAELDSINRLQTATNRASDVSVIVDAAPVRSALAEGEISLKFGMDIVSTSGILNEDLWDQVIADFVANDLQVGEVTLETPNPYEGIELANLSNNFDCYYIRSNMVQSATLAHILSIDPLTTSDPNFDINDYPLSILSQVQRDGQIWALPLSLAPQVMAYNPQLLDQNSAPHPYPGWTTTDFENILRSMKIDPEDPAAFTPLDIGSSHVFGLIASYGGLPLDYRTNPLTVNFTDPMTVEAIRRVLDLAKDGYLTYNPLSDLSYGAITVDVENSDIPLFSMLLNGFFFDLAGSETFAMVEFPQEGTYMPLVSDLGSAYISATTLHAEACYRFMTTISDHPELFTGMPARRSQLTNPELQLVQGSKAVAFYQHLGSLIDQGNAVPFPSGYGSSIEVMREFLTYSWLNRAFDRYVLEDADLELELEEAEIYTIGFQQCAADLPSFDVGDDLFEYFGKYNDCALQVDPSMEGTFLSF